ncbi:MAG: adenylate/guanylate cyclase domain-containing protein [Actinomycetota bacterium]
MLHFPEAERALPCLLALVPDGPSAGLPPGHAGMHAGPVVAREGDYFGGSVNLASRVAQQAAPGEVLLTEEARVHSPDGIASFEPRGPIALKGLARPITLYRAQRLGDPGSAGRPPQR